MSTKAPLQKKITIDGEEYIIQHPGVRGRFRIVDQSTLPGGTLSKEKYADAMLEHVVVQPKRKLEDFDSNPDALDELLGECDKLLFPKRN